MRINTYYNITVPRKCSMNKQELIKLLKQNGGKAPPAAGTT